MRSLEESTASTRPEPGASLAVVRAASRAVRGADRSGGSEPRPASLRPLTPDGSARRRLIPVIIAALAALAACAPSPLVHQRAAEQLRRGYRHLEAGDGERAEVAFRHALAFAPDLPEGWNGVGVVARWRGDLQAARRHFTEAVRLAPGFAEGRANLGEALLAAGRPGEAEEELRAALRLDPDLAAARLNLARSLLHRGLLDAPGRAEGWSAARREYLHLLEAAPDHPAALADLAFLDYLSGRPGPAAEGWRRAAEASPSAEARLGECLALVRLRRCQEALAACDRCLALAPALAPCRSAHAAAQACARP